MIMQHPYQHLAVVEHDSVKYLVAAAGSALLVTIQEGAIVSQWSSTECLPVDVELSERPAKRQRTSESASRIIDVSTATRSDHFLVVTEDKNIHVLKLEAKGQVKTCSKRCMPKRPCAVQLLAPEQLILCADKHGDVYSLPLLPDPEEDAKYAPGETEDDSKPAKAFVPSATTLTVHTKRNRLALASQQQQKIFTQKKAPLAFEHKLIIGHVSMLTDVAYVRSDQHRNRIVTADRDEHIRVSRTPPQAYVIEGFCFGHKEFVSKLCPIEGTTLIASGGGDDWIGIWDWTTCSQTTRYQVRQKLMSMARGPDTLPNIAVSALRHVQQHNVLVVLCEKVKAVVLLDLSSDEVSIHLTEAIPIDVVVFGGSLIVAFDARGDAGPRLLSYNITRTIGKDITLKVTEQAAPQLLNEYRTEEVDAAGLDQMLYNIEQLRKRASTDAEAEEDG